VTLLFSQAAYEAVADAYITGLERFSAQGGDVSQISSVASFFISRIDTAINGLINAQLNRKPDSHLQDVLNSLLGKCAIANAKLTYRKYHDLYQSPRWQSLAAQGAQPQRLLWASTGSKKPYYRDVVYVEELIGADTMNTVPPVTLAALLIMGSLA
jgi:transaldolase / glucose-6-phosphate isomerase